jgi:hypothetical protein
MVKMRYEPFTTLKGRQATLMALAAYFDGSKSQECKLLTLAGLAASNYLWSGFADEWRSVLDKAGAASYWHSNEAFLGKGAYRGWNKKRVHKLAIELAKVLCFYAGPNNVRKSDMITFSCTINLSDYEKAKKKLPKLRSPVDMCLDHCVGSVISHVMFTAMTELFFDREEPFQPRLLELWRTQRPFWANKIAVVAPMRDMREHPPLQAADFLAWTANRYYRYGPDHKWSSLFAVTFLAARRNFAVFDSSSFLEVFDQNGKYKKGVQIPMQPIMLPRGFKFSR